MDSLDFDRFDGMIKEGWSGGILGSFEVLQEIVETVMLVALHDPMSELLRLQFYGWYCGHLLYLHGRAEKGEAAVGYQVKKYDSYRVALSRIEAVIGTLSSLRIADFVKNEAARIEEKLAGAA